MKRNLFPLRRTLAAALPLLAAASLRADPMLTSWFTAHSGQYARVRAATGAAPATTWTDQTLPAYSDVQEIDSSGGYVYVRVTGLASHTMGPWYLDAAKTQAFPNWPVNQNSTYRFPRSPSVSATKAAAGLGPVGLWVNGVALYNVLDGHFYVAGSGDTGNGTGVWNRDAREGEGATFDPAFGHQPGSGQYHYHVSSAALRFQLGDSMAYDAATDTYTNDLSNVRHSPILGWSFDGYPIYGPYGYAAATNSASGVRLMTSGYRLRDGSSNTVNLAGTGRITLPAWAAAVQGTSAALSSANDGPVVSASYPLGWYIEDYEHLGDVGGAQGVDFDLDRYNGRFCVTPEFPGGTYAYFVTVAADGSPAFPYVMNRQYYGAVAGGAVAGVTETVATNLLAGPDSALVIGLPSTGGAHGDVTLTWSSTEGGAYKVEAADAIPAWSVLATNTSAAAGVQTAYVDAGAGAAHANRFYRVSRVALASYSSTAGTEGTTTAGGGGGTGDLVSVSPASGSRGASSLQITITLDASATPPLPPSGIVPTSVTIGSLTATSLARPSSTTVTALLAIPSGSSTGAQTVTVTFAGAGGDAGPSYTLANGFTIH